MTRALTKNFGTSLNFIGSAATNLVNIGSSSNFPVPANTNIAFAGWVNVRSLGQMCVFASGATSGVQSGFRFIINSSLGLSVSLGDGVTRTAYNSTVGNAIQKNVWTHIAFIADRVNGNLYFYVNGIQLGNAVSISAYNSSSLNSGITPNIGGINNVAWFDGFMDDISIWIGDVPTSEDVFNLAFGKISNVAQPVAQYLFNEGTGSSATDSTGNGNTGTISGATYSSDVPMVLRNEAKGTIASLSASNTNGLDDQWADLENGPLIPQNSSCTVSCWVKPKNTATSGAGWLIVKPYGSASAGRAGSIVLNTTRTISFIMVNSSGTNFDLASPASVVWTKDVWTHIVGTYDAPTGLMSLYIDGVLVKTLAATANSTPTGTNKMYFFSERDTGTPRTLPATLNQVRIWKRVLSATEVEYLYSKGTYIPDSMRVNLLGEWLFNEGQNSTTIVDTSGNGKNMDINGALTYVGDAPSKQRLYNRTDMKSSLSFAGAGYAQLPAIPTTTGLSITAWIKTQTPVPAAAMDILGRSAGSSDLFEITTSGELRYNLVTSGGTNNLLSAANVLPKNTWCHVAGTYDITTGVANLYLNGVIIATQTAGSGTMTNNASTWLLGALTTVTRNFTGNIVDVRMFDGALTSAQVLNIYQGNSDITTNPTLVAKYALDQGAGNPIDTSGKGYNATSISGATYVLDTPFYKRQAVNPNLVKNGDFEYAPPFTAATNTITRWIDGTASGSSTNDLFGWAIEVQGSSGTVTAQYDNSNVNTGNYSIKISTTATASNCVVRNLLNSGNVASVLKYGIQVLPSTSYSASFWMKTMVNSGNATSGAFLRISEANGAATVTTNNDSTKVNTTTGWTHYTMSFSTQPTTRFLIPQLSIIGADGTATLIMDAWFDDITLKPTTATTRLTA